MRTFALVPLAAIVLLASVAFLAPAQAEEGWRTHPVGRSGLAIDLPEAWTVLTDELEGRLVAKSHDAPAVRLTASATAAASEASLEDLRDDAVRLLFGRWGTEATIEDEAERSVGERPALWTLLAYEGASGPRRSLLVVCSDVTLRFDLAADGFAARRALMVEIAGSLRAAEATQAGDGEAAPMDVAAMELLRAFMTRLPRSRAQLDALARSLGRQAERTVGERPALWTLLAYEGASGPRRSLLVVQSDATLRFDLAADVFPARRALMVEIAGSLRAAEATEADSGEAAPVDVEAMELLRAFMTHVPRSRAELDELARSLGREAEVDDALGVLDELIAAAGTGGEEVLALVGWRRFHHPLPEALHYRGHDFLRTVEEANAQRWFGPDERAAHTEARRAWARTQDHLERLEKDHRYRAADQMLANLAHEPALKGLPLVALSSPPYLLVHVGEGEQEAVTLRLEREGETLEAVYRTLLDGYAEALGLADLTAPYGGRPDLAATYRSFPDGMVLVALVPADDAVAQALDGASDDRGGWGLPALSRARPDRLLLAPEENLEATAVMGAKQLLLAFTRQRNRWGEARRAFAAILDGFARQFAAVEQDGDGQTSFPWDAAPHLASMRALARAQAERGRPYPLLPLRRLIAFGSVTEAARAMEGLASFGGTPPQLRVRALFDQSWALATFLMEAENGRWRDAYLRAVRAGLDRQIGPGGRNEVAFARAFGLGDSTAAGGWNDLESAWTRFVREELLQGTAGVAGAPTKEASPVEPDQD